MNKYGILGILWIIFCTTVMLIHFGKTFSSEEIIINARIVVLVLLSIGVPFICGFLGRKL